MSVDVQKCISFSRTMIERRIQQLNTPVPMKYISIPLYKPFLKPSAYAHVFLYIYE